MKIPERARQLIGRIAWGPLRWARARVQWRLSRERKERAGLTTLTLFLHGDPHGKNRGGTERHVDALSREVLGRGTREVFLLFPDAPGSFRVRLLQPGAPAACFDSTCREGRAGAIVERVLRETDVLHVHHIQSAAPHLLSLLCAARCRRKVFTAHDYLSICPSVTLVGEEDRYCGLPADLAACNLCLRRRHRYTAETIERYRRRLRDFLATTDQVLVPSESAREVLVRGLSVPGPAGEAERARDEALLRKIAVLDNFLLFGGERHLGELAAEAPASAGKKLVFLGALLEHKGAGLARACRSRLAQAGYEVEVWGGYFGAAPAEGLPVRPYADWQGLLALGRTGRPQAVCVPSNWPETYSFTTFEGLALLRAPLLVGPYGNPARVVRDLGVGVAMTDFTEEAFFAALHELEAGHAAFQARIAAIWRQVVMARGPSAYLDRLEAIYDSDRASARAPDRAPVPVRR